MCTHAVYNNVYLVTVGRVIVDAGIGLASMCTHAAYNNVYLFTVGRLIDGDGIGLASMCTHAVYNNVYLFTVGRVIVGAGIGLASMCVPIYISETAPPHLRGSQGAHRVNPILTMLAVNIVIILTLTTTVLGLYEPQHFGGL